MKAVFDTNIYISAFVVPGGNAEEAYLRALKGEFTLYTSLAILTEMAQTLEKKFGWQADKIAQLLKAISKVAPVIKTYPHLHVLADEPDNRILECVIEAKADFVVTGDRHLLTLKTFQNTTIVTLSNFLASLKKSEV